MLKLCCGRISGTAAIRLESKRKAESEKRYKIIKYKKKM